MISLTVVGFASGSPLSELAMRRIARDHHLCAVVVPRPRSGLVQALRRAVGRSADPLSGLGVPLIDATQVERFRCDAIVVASFPQIIPDATLSAARIGALNVHMSLLPRHRGPDPLFWTYWDDDREAGVTIHWRNERIDGGDVAAQEALSFERGLASRELYMRLALRGIDLLAGVLAQVAAGGQRRELQQESLATYESAADIARARVPFAQWPAERVWHVLRGLGDQRSGLVTDAGGQRLKHGRATQYRATGDVEPGRVVAGHAGYELHCRDGIVAVERRPSSS